MFITVDELKENGITDIIDINVFLDLLYGNIPYAIEDGKDIRSMAETAVLKAKKVELTQMKLEGLKCYSENSVKLIGIRDEFQSIIKNQSKKFTNTLCRLNMICDKQLVKGLIDLKNDEFAIGIALAFAKLKFEKLINNKNMKIVNFWSQANGDTCEDHDQKTGICKTTGKSCDACYESVVSNTGLNTMAEEYFEQYCKPYEK